MGVPAKNVNILHVTCVILRFHAAWNDSYAPKLGYIIGVIFKGQAFLLSACGTRMLSRKVGMGLPFSSA